MSFLLIAPGMPMRLGGGRAALWRPLASTVTPPAATLTAITGLSGWWDAAQPATMADANTIALSGWNQPVARITDRSTGSRPLLPYRAGAGTAAPMATPRLAALLGGAGRVAGGAGTLAPALDPDLGWRLTDVNFGSASAWTRLLVWSRPNTRQNSGHDSTPVALLTTSTTPIMQAEATRLLVFGQPVKTDLARRHTHSMILRHTPGAGIDVWIDGTQAATAIANPLPASASAPMTLLHDTSANGAAQCWLHEAAMWERALNSGEISSLLGYLTRWARGPRQGITLVFNGQSNALNYAMNDGAAALLAQGVGWHLGTLAANIVASYGGAAYTLMSGHGLYPAVGGVFPGSFVDSTGGGDPAMWPLGTDGQATQAALAALSTTDRADIAALVWPWNETDSLRAASEKATFKAAAQRFLALERAMLGRGAAELPLIWWNAIPYGSAAGIQTHREVVGELAADASQHVIIGNPMTADSNPRNAAWDANTGIASGGDSAHRDTTDNIRFARLAAPVVARAILAAGRVDAFGAIPAGLPSSGGPRITQAVRETATSILLTIQHDAGNDLLVPLQAANGAGFAVMDGGNVGAAGPIRAANACVRVDATHLRITLATPMTLAAASCLLFYPYGAATIGRGNAVTDNFSQCTRQAGWDIGADLGSAWNINFPLAATFTPIPMSTA